MADALDAELIGLINRLNKAQAVVGGPSKSKHVTAFGEDGKIDRFLDLRNQMMERINEIIETLKAVQQMEKSPGSNPKGIIEGNSKIRTELKTLTENWEELDGIYKAEAKKKRSKYSKESMQERQQVLTALRLEIEKIREMQRKGYNRNYNTVQLATMENSELFRGGPAAGSGAGGGMGGGRNNDMTAEHKSQLQALKQRDQQIDQQIAELGKGVDILTDLARSMNEEVKIQNKMLDSLEQNIDDVKEHVTTINAKLKTTLEEARKSDKICVDIFCILLMVGMIIILYRVTSDKDKAK
jgi:DNA repair ATPase RecN